MIPDPDAECECGHEYADHYGYDGECDLCPCEEFEEA